MLVEEYLTFMDSRPGFVVDSGSEVNSEPETEHNIFVTSRNSCVFALVLGSQARVHELHSKCLRHSAAERNGHSQETCREVRSSERFECLQFFCKR